MIIKNAEVFEEDGSFVRKDICVLGNRIVEEADYKEQGRDISDEPSLDFSGLKAIPMLVDIHFHGCDGVDFCDGTEEAIEKIAAYELREGIGAICPATMTYGEETLTQIARAAAAYKNRACAAEACSTSLQSAQNVSASFRSVQSEYPLDARRCPAADLVGINMEGPFISRKKKGAQNEAYIHRPDAEMFLRLQKEAGGLFRLCDLAPEEPGAMECIRKLRGQVVLSLAHTCTDYETAKQAFAEGASHMTHLYNAMPGISHRMPGPIVAAWEAGAEVELIADGIHIHPAVVRLTFQLFGDDRVILISDSMMATGLPDGQYTLGGQDVTVTGNRAVLTQDPDTIAGSATNLMDCLRTAVRSMGIPLGSAVRAAAVNPARCIGVDRLYGSLRPGCYANILIVNENLDICHMIHKGVLLY
ncbi:MAG: N-acetylglucosamine-6-phosphate deacetylase [Lachnospiraceae bacterium]|nr:N-acetylglucosamine-6-phosphate deacetylase [Lachnospiraceae bacterium]